MILFTIFIQPRGARRSQEQPGAARRSQEQPGGTAMIREADQDDAEDEPGGVVMITNIRIENCPEHDGDEQGCSGG